MSDFPKYWINRLTSIASQSQEIPMWGSIPEFPWQILSTDLARAFSLKELSIRCQKADWQKKEELTSHLGTHPFCIGVECSPIKGDLFFLLSSQDFNKISSWTISKEDSPLPLEDFHLQHGYFYYLALESLKKISKMEFFRHLSLQLHSDIEFSLAEGYTIDVQLCYQQEIAFGKIVCSETFQKECKRYFSKQSPLTFPSQLRSELFLSLDLHAGSVQLSQEEWDQIASGDFVLLDHCSYSPNTKKGTLQLKMHNHPLFQVKLKQEQLKILDYALYYQETHMDHPEDDHAFDQSESEPSYEGEDSESFADEEETLSSSEEEGEKEKEKTIEKNASLLSPNQIPLSLSVEVGKLHISLEKLLTLKPGNVLSLKVRPEDGVYLTSAGKRVARGELVQIGDVIGVKITEVGNSPQSL